jgi:hypothetical protein
LFRYVFISDTDTGTFYSSSTVSLKNGGTAGKEETKKSVILFHTNATLSPFQLSVTLFANYLTSHETASQMENQTYVLK